jgi:enamine deaminase RidA (YjgF/YER057c/UK114 family)
LERKTISSGAVWEDIIGYSRAVIVGNLIEISGTTSIKDGEVHMPNDCYAQTLRIYEIVQEVLASVESKLEDVVRVRVFVTDISKWEEVGKAHAQYFKNIKPAMTMVEVSALIDPSLVVEIEVSAIKVS